MKIFGTLKMELDNANEYDTLFSPESGNYFRHKARGIIDVIKEDYAVMGENINDLTYMRRCDIPDWINNIQVDSDRLGTTYTIDIDGYRYVAAVDNVEDLYTVCTFHKINLETKEEEIIDLGEVDGNDVIYQFVLYVTQYDVPVYTLDNLIEIENGVCSYCYRDDNGEWTVDEYGQDGEG